MESCWRARFGHYADSAALCSPAALLHPRCSYDRHQVIPAFHAQACLWTIIGPERPLPIVDGVERILTGCEFYPQSVEHAVHHTWDVADHVPVVATGNRIAIGDDSRRIEYAYYALAGLHKAMDDGIDMRGYLHWSLLDNYE
ncbi:family 1 glycosylhydrolase [Bifidobacterium actinocoloniiforme]|uniref:family 1 glycosylhydrolase n=1 Tax=Bifidobacterium actinocoloniiforme TaxID=638619 RepID=UPI001EEDCFB1|nr:family 1 glycosylhydrolase [Bifidobacterium actinocoloniiforme]